MGKPRARLFLVLLSVRGPVRLPALLPPKAQGTRRRHRIKSQVAESRAGFAELFPSTVRGSSLETREKNEKNVIEMNVRHAMLRRSEKRPPKEVSGAF